jgi:hypothetical protein
MNQTTQTALTQEIVQKLSTLTPSELGVASLAITVMSEKVITGEKIRESLDNGAVIDQLQIMEKRSPLLGGPGVTVAELALIEWLQDGAAPAPPLSDPEDVRYALEEVEDKQAFCERLTAENTAWWLCVKALQARLKTFVDMEIPEPQAITMEETTA